MADPRRASNATDPRQDLEGLVRNLRLRLEGESRSGLAAVGRAPKVAARPPAEPVAQGREDDADAAAPEQRAAQAVRRELETAVAAAHESPSEDEMPPEDEMSRAPAPAVHVKGPGLFDASSPDLEGGASREDALGRIVQEVAQCDRCPELVAGRTHTVPGQGSPYAKLMFIGEGPGADEDLQGLAFVGRAGQLLTKMIAAINMTREEVFIANIVKCRPPANRRPGPEECANCAPYLARQIEIIRPKVIVALGGTAAQYLLQTHDGITRLRGRFYPYMGTQLMPTFHPAFVLRSYTPDTRKKVYDDLLAAKAELTKA